MQLLLKSNQYFLSLHNAVDEQRTTWMKAYEKFQAAQSLLLYSLIQYRVTN